MCQEIKNRAIIAYETVRTICSVRQLSIAHPLFLFSVSLTGSFPFLINRIEKCCSKRWLTFHSGLNSWLEWKRYNFFCAVICNCKWKMKWQVKEILCDYLPVSYQLEVLGHNMKSVTRDFSPDRNNMYYILHAYYMRITCGSSVKTTCEWKWSIEKAMKAIN